ncbi:MAG: electron transport complex subunit RsxC [Spirochaetes bacterium]|nr:electron transport complex subunit RsxC [Spirochaetota bacterium]
MKIKSFSKGIHPHYFKEITDDLPIINIDLPDTISIPLSQHLGTPAKCIKKKGDEVKIGEIIGESQGTVSANIHSPISGKITNIIKKPLPGGNIVEHIEIKVNKEETLNHKWNKIEIKLDNLKSEEILNHIHKNGIVGMGGATFPVYYKYKSAYDKIKDKPIDIFVVNGAECEPFLTSDSRLMLEKTMEILRGIEIVHKIFNFNKIYIGIEINKRKALTRFNELKAEFNMPIEVVPLETKYPQGAEKMLIYSVSKRKVPKGGLPFDVGAIVSNVGTLFAIYEAFYYNKPSIDRIITVTGDAINKPGNFIVPNGMIIEDIIKFCGGLKENTMKVILGGPMMGKALPNLEYSTTKGTSGILCLTKKFQIQSEENHCIKCSSCISVCPMNLLPNKLAELAKAKYFDEIKQYDLYNCIECGSCSYSCPANIQIVGWIKYAKSYIRYKGLV